MKSVVGRRTLFKTGGNVESLAVRGGAIEAVSRVLVLGDGCGCLDSPVWSPDGSKIAYFDGAFWNQQIEPQPPDAALAVMNADGSGRHDLTPRNTLGAGPTWSPDGRRIAFAEQSRTNPFPEVIVVANADGSGSLQLGPGDDPAWSPDGSQIAFASAGCGGSVAAISTMSPDGSNIHQLASFGPGPSCLGQGGMAWSPDGTRIAFSLNGMLEEMNADGSNAHPLGTNTMGDEPAWSPDSNQIVFREAGGLWEIGADGSGLHKLTNGPDEHPSWSPDNATIVFGSDRNDAYANSGETYDGASPELYLVAPDGGNLRPLTFTKPSAFEQQTTFHRANGKPLPALPGLPALAGNIAAVGSTSAAGHQIALFDATTGAQIAVVPAGGGGRAFAVAGADAKWVVFRLGRTISGLEVHSHKVVRFATTAAAPLDLSVAGRRVAWAENLGGRGRIRAFELPG